MHAFPPRPPRAVSLVVVLVCGWLVSACGDPGYPSGRACVDHGQCEDGLYCFPLAYGRVGNYCLKSCAQNLDCATVGVGSDGKVHNTCCRFTGDLGATDEWCAPADCWGSGTPVGGGGGL